MSMYDELKEAMLRSLKKLRRMGIKPKLHFQDNPTLAMAFIDLNQFARYIKSLVKVPKGVSVNVYLAEETLIIEVKKVE